MRRSITVLLFVAAVVSAPLVVTFVRELSAVDACLDAGGSFDYVRMACDHAANHPFVPFTARHPALSWGTGGALVLALVGTGLVGWRRLSR